MTGPKPPPDRSWTDWGEDDHAQRGRIARFSTDHTNWYACIIVAGLVVVIGGAMALLMALGSGGPALVYDPQVVHRQITVDGRTVDCAVSHSGMSCDWTK